MRLFRSIICCCSLQVSEVNLFSAADLCRNSLKLAAFTDATVGTELSSRPTSVPISARVCL